MTAASNPFRPGFGESPTFWAGRRPILDAYRTAIASGAGSVGRMVLINGSRGIGKTTLVNELEDIATSNGWILLRAPSHRGMLDELVNTLIPTAINAFRGNPGRRVSGASIAGIGSVSTEIDTGETVTPTLSSQLRKLAEITTANDSGILITVDEIQAADSSDVDILATAVQDLVRDSIPVSFIGAGLTAGIQELLSSRGTTFLRRSRRYQLAPLQPDDAIDLLVRTSEQSGIDFDEDAAVRATNAAFGYPYLLQLIGSLAWDAARAHGSGHVTDSLVRDAVTLAVPVLGDQVHQPELAALPHAQLDFLHAMATVMDTLDPEGMTAFPVKIRDVATELGKTTTSVSTARAALINRDIIHGPAWGQVAFRLPYLREFLDSPGGPLEVS